METKKVGIFGASVPSAVKTVTAAITLKSGENHIRTAGTGTFTVTLPPILDCAGETFVISATSAATVTVASSDASILTSGGVAWTSDDLTASGDILIVKNVNGVCWLVQADKTT